MSADGTELESGGSRPSNGTNSAKSHSGAEPGDSDTPAEELPTPAERTREFVEEFGETAFVPLSTTEGQELRAECTEEVKSLKSVETEDTEFTVPEVEERTAVPWAAAVESFLEWYEGYRHRRLKMSKGQQGTLLYESFEVPLNNSYSQEYQQAEYAKLRALERETCGGERPSGGRSGGRFERPVVAMLTRSASSVEDDEARPPVDHDREIADAWSTGGVRRSLRYVMEKAGFDRSDWVYWRQSEPHTGEKASAQYGESVGYGHEHIMVICDAAAVDAEVTEGTFRPIIAEHVEKCDHAGAAAHGEDAVEVRPADEIASVAGYMAKYIANDPEEDLLERPLPYIAWAASQWATGTQRATRSDSANHAVRADACRQRAESADADQEYQHGEEIVRSEKRGYTYECRECGSAWGIDQSHDTLVSARLADREESAVVAIGGAALDLDPEQELRDRWQDATEAAHVDLERDVSVHFERVPQWSPEAILEGYGEDAEERPANGLGGVDMRALKFPAARNPELAKIRESGGGPKLRCACQFATYDVEAFERHARECEERSAGAPLDSVLSVERVGEESCEVAPGVDVNRGRIRQYIVTHSVESVAEVCGALSLPPGARSVVEAML